jgi:mannosylglycerate hydrolase
MDNKRIHVISNTHWDREHRHGFQETRIMLVELIDELIEIMENNPNYKYFTFDGQSIVIDDYLEVKPQMKKRLSTLIKDGRILIGPWYSLLDCNSANGEAIVRNLLKGYRYCEEYSGAMKLGYSIFSFGQIAQMPQIYSGFGIDTILFYKNPNREVLPKSEFFWVAPDGTQAFSTRLGKFNRWNFFFNFSVPVILGGDARIPGWQAKFNDYGRLCHMADDNFIDQYAQELEQDIGIREEKIVQSVNDVLASVDDSVSNKVFLGFEGTDFTSPLKDIPHALERANELMNGEVELIHSNPVEYIKELKADIDTSTLVKYSGEMRFGPVHAVHSEVLAANVELKQAAFKAENTLLYYAEPFMAFGTLLGYKYPKEILDKAWIYMFQAYTHDSIHGSGVPKLKPDNMYNIAQAQEIADSVARRAVENLLCEINMDCINDGDILFTVFNPTPYERCEVMRVQLDLPAEELVKDMWIEELNGEKVEFYRHSVNKFHLSCVNRPNRPKTVYSDRVDMDVFVKDVPAYGYKVMKVKRIKGDPEQYQPFTPVGVFPHHPIGKSGNILDNGLLKATINSNGAVDIFDYETGITHMEINVFSDSGCSGNMWAHKTPDNNKIISSKGCSAEIGLIRNSGISATYRVAIVMNIPEGLDSDRKGRLKSVIPTEIVSEITLTKGSRRVDFKTYFENRCKDHLLTVRIPVNVKAEHSFSECPFEVRKRPIGTIGRDRGIIDDRLNLTRHIMHNFVDISDGDNGIAVLAKGLKECEVAGEESPVVILTLLRAATNSIPIHDDLFVEFKDETSQCIGNQCFEYSVQLHSMDWFEGKVVPASRRYNLPMAAVQIGRGKGGRLPLQGGFFELKESNMALSGIKQSEDRSGTIIRLFNPSDRTVTETIEILHGFEAVYLTDMNEQVIEKINSKESNRVHLEVTPFKIVTLKIDWKGI